MKIKSFIFVFLFVLNTSVKSQLVKQFNCPIKITSYNATSGNKIEITGTIDSQVTIVDASEILPGDMLYDIMRRTYKILSLLPDNAGTTFSVEAEYLGGGPAGSIDPATSPGIISRPTVSGFPLISDEDLYAAVLNSAIMSVDAKLTKFKTGPTLPSITGPAIGAVVYNTTDNTVWRLSLLGWEKVTSISDDYVDISAPYYIAPAGTIINNQLAPYLGYYISDGTSWTAAGIVNALADPLPKFGDVFQVTGDKVYMFTASGTWEPISGGTVSPVQPTSPKVGDFYYDTTKNILYVYDATNNWVEVSTNGSTPNNSPAPIATKEGELYFDSSDKKLYVNNGVQWMSVDNSLPNGKVYIGNAAGEATPKDLTGDVMVANTGVTTIQPNRITDAMLKKSLIPLSGFAAPVANIPMGGLKFTNLGNPAASPGGDQDAATKSYVDTHQINLSTIPLTNGHLLLGGVVATIPNKAMDVAPSVIPINSFGAATDSISMGNSRIANLKDPVAPQNAATKKYVDATSGVVPIGIAPPVSPLAGTIYYNLTDKRLYIFQGGLWKPADNSLPTGMVYVGDVNGYASPTLKSNILLSDLGAAAADVSLGGFKITNLADPIAGAAGLQNAATRKYVDDKVSTVSTPSGTVFPSTPTESSTFYNTTSHLYYVYNGTDWIPMGNDLLNTQLYVGDVNNKAVSTPKANIPMSGFAAATADVTMGGYKITNLADPVAGAAGLQNATTRKYVDDKIATVATTTGAGYPPTTPVPAAGTTYYDTLNKIYYVSNGTDWIPMGNDLPNNEVYVGDATNKAVPTLKTSVPLSDWGAPTANVSMGGLNMINLADPRLTAAGLQDAATRKYVDSKTGSVTTGTTPPPSPVTGTTYYNTTDKIFYVYDGTAWIPVNNILPTGELYVGDATNKAVPVAKSLITLSGFGDAQANISMGTGSNNYKIINVADPAGDQDAATKKYVDGKTGSVPTTIPGTPVAGNTYFNTTDKTFYVYDGTKWVPVDNTLANGKLYVGDATNKAVATDKSAIPLSGFGIPTTSLALGAFQITGLGDPTANQDAATKKYVDDKTGSVPTTIPGTPVAGNTYFNTTDKTFYVYDGTKWVPVDNTLANGKLYVGDATNKAVATDKSAIPLSGFGSPTTSLALGAFQITGLGDPTANQDAATKKYVDDKTGSVPTIPSGTPVVGSTYYNTTDKLFYVYDGIGWVPVNNTLPNGELYVGDATNKAVPVAKSLITLSGFGDAQANISMGTGSNNYKIINVADPAGDQDAATKKYVDAKTSGVTTGPTAPPTPTTGTTYYNTTNKILYVYDGTGWVPAVPGDNMGNHTATQNIKMVTFAINSDGGNGKGVTFDTPGNATFAQDVTVNGNFYTPSDQRLKKNIETLGNALQSIDSMRGVRFEYKDQKKYAKGSKIGVIAQELMKVFPEMVTKGTDGFYKVDYTQLSAVLIQAVKEQQKLMQQQQLEINDLKNRLDKQQLQINAILKKIE